MPPKEQKRRRGSSNESGEEPPKKRQKGNTEDAEKYLQPLSTISIEQFMAKDSSKRGLFLRQIGVSKTDAANFVNALHSSSDEFFTILSRLPLAKKSHRLIKACIQPSMAGAEESETMLTNTNNNTNVSAEGLNENTNTNNNDTNLTSANTNIGTTNLNTVSFGNTIIQSPELQAKANVPLDLHRSEIAKWTAEDVARVLELNGGAEVSHLVRANFITGVILVNWVIDDWSEVKFIQLYNLGGTITVLLSRLVHKVLYKDIILQYWNKNLDYKRPDPSLISGFGKKLVQQEQEVEMLWQLLLDHFVNGKKNQWEKNDHHQCIAYDSPGVGKTRLGIDCIGLLKEFGKNKSQPTADEQELLTYLDSCLMLHITFGNGCMYNVAEDTSVDSALVVRAICSAHGLSSPIAELKQSHKFIRTMMWPDVLDILSTQFQSKMIYVHLDAVNALPANLLQGTYASIKTAIQSIGRPITEFPILF